MAIGQSDGWQFPDWGFLSPGNSRLCQIDKKQTSTHCTVVKEKQKKERKEVTPVALMKIDGNTSAKIIRQTSLTELKTLTYYEQNF